MSEHADRAQATLASRAFLASLGPKLAKRNIAQRDQVFVRKPNYKSLKTTRQVVDG